MCIVYCARTECVKRVVSEYDGMVERMIAPSVLLGILSE